MIEPGKRWCAGLLVLLLGVTQAWATGDPEPHVDLNKTVSTVESNHDGTYSTTITLRVKNVGHENLVKLQLKDDLDIFGAGRVAGIGTPEVLQGDLTPNPDYDGLDDIRLLGGADTLAPGKQAKLRFEITFDPADETGPFTNRAVVWAEGEESGKGIDVTAKARIRLPPVPMISMHKSFDDVVVNGDGTVTATITLSATNVGNENLIKLQMEDDLDIFGAGRVTEIGTPTVVEGDLTFNPDYDGLDDIRLLEGNDTLRPGRQATLLFEVTFDPGPEPGPFTNRAVAWAEGKESGTGVDDSDDATIHLPLIPAIDLDKAAGEVVSNGDGSMSAPITLTVTNTGSERLERLQIVDDLDIFGAGQLLAVENLSAPDLSLNFGFDGLTDTFLLEGDDPMLVGAVAMVTFVVRFDPGPEPGPFMNSATAWAEGKSSGAGVDDTDDATIRLPVASAIMLEKSAGEVVSNGDGSLSVPVSLLVTNSGEDVLETLQIEDDLDIFGSTGQLLAVESITAPGLSLNPAFDGLADIQLLDGSDILAVAGTASITFTLRFDPGTEQGPFINRATATATGEVSGDVVSASDDGSFPGTPTEPPMADISLEKSAGDVTANGDGSLSVPISLTVTNSGQDFLESLQIEDDLDIFGAGQLPGVENITAPDLSLNPDYDGTTDTVMLDGSDALAAGVTAEVSFVIRFDPGVEPGPFINRADASAVGRFSRTPVSASADVSIPVVPPPPPAAIMLEKSAGEVVSNGDGSLSVPISLLVTNSGQDLLESLQVEDDLDIFGAGQLLAVENITAPDLSLNPDYDGMNDTSLLSGTDTLAVAGTARVTFTLRFDPVTEPGPFTNRADASAVGRFSRTPVNASDDVEFPATPTQPPLAAMELEKTAGDVTSNGDGSLSAPITITVTNSGEDLLEGLQIEDDLNIFGSTGQLLAVENLSAPGLNVNPAFDGITDTLILDGSDTLDVASSETITFVVRFDPGNESGPFLNTAAGTATGALSGSVVSASDNAAIVGGPSINAAMELEKTAGDVASNGDGSLSVPISILVTNNGGDRLEALQVEDDLDIFGNTGQLLAIENISAPGLTLNPAFDGLTDVELLDGTDSLAVTQAVEITFVVRFDPGSEPGPFLNSADASAIGEISRTPVSASGDISFPATPTEPPMAGIALEKSAGDVTANGDGSLSVPISVVVTNAGDELLETLQIEDDLDIFGAGQLLAVENITAPDLSLNPEYDGTTDTLLLDGTDSLAVAQSAEITFVVRFDPGAEPGPFINRADASAVGRFSRTPVRASDDVTFPGTPTLPPAGIALEKTAGEVTSNGDGSLSVPISLLVTNSGQDLLESLQIEDDLDIFGAGQLLAVEDIVAPGLSLNANFDGLTDILLLDGTDTLVVAGTASVTFTIRFDPAAEPGPFTNRADASAVGEISRTPVSASDDVSFQGAPPPPPAAIALAKSVGQFTLNGDGSLSVPFSLLVTNTGQDLLGGLQIEDDLDIFGSGQLLAIDSITAPGLSINPGYDGLSDTLLLDGTDSLAVGATAQITLVVRFDPGTESGPFRNTATATATGAGSGNVVSATDAAQFAGGIRGLFPLIVSKVADRSVVVRGDIVGYDVTVTNLSSGSIPNVVAVDNPPAGFRFVADSGVLTRPGPDGILDTPDDPPPERIGSTGIDPVTFDPFDLAPNERVRISYITRVSVGVANGSHTNTVVVTPPSPLPPAEASATVTLDLDPIFEKSTIIGKVFHDTDGDYRQGERDPGIPGVRLGTASGLTIETDAFGRFHVADIDVGRFERGALFILKLDTSSLPEGAEVVSENPRVIRLTQATLSRINFAVTMPDPGAWDVSAGAGVRATANQGGTADEPDATATEIEVSGGPFGCNVLVADVLPGRKIGDKPDQASVVTVYANAVVESSDAGCPPGPEQHEYPIEVITKAGSKIEITAAGDVRRREIPLPEKSKEHIVVTPYRDESRMSEVTALRIANEGIEPMTVADRDRRDVGIGATDLRATAEPLIIDPRLDVLALNQALVDDDGWLTADIRFTAYSNYSYFVRGYALEIYGRSIDGFDRRLLRTISRGAVGPEQDFVFDGRDDNDNDIDLSRYVDLEYLLKASNCDGSFDPSECRVDVTNPRLLKLPRTGDRSIGIHTTDELWGKTNLAEQRISIRGSRVRIRGTVPAGYATVRVTSPMRDWRGDLVARVSNGKFVIEEHLPSIEWTFVVTAEGDGQPRGEPVKIPAGATNIRVEGGLFGCRDLTGELPGRASKDEPSDVALTVVVDEDIIQTAALPPGCDVGDESDRSTIKISTGEGSVIHVTAAGDVLRDGFPERHPILRDERVNNQQIEVMPFRDYTDSSVITALRIANEGYKVERGAGTALPVLQSTISVSVQDAKFLVAMANLTVGRNSVSGNAGTLSADSRFDGSTFTDGRLALYGKRQIDGKYRLTAQMDSTEDDLGKLTDNLKRKDPRRIFRQLDTDRHYAIYGDDSTTTTDVDTQGAFYLRMDWDRNTALWGNYNTGMTDTEFMQYNRSLYGAKFRHENQDSTEYGDATTELTLFGSEAQSVAAHVTFKATGGSLYYLRHTDIVQGSEKAWIEVRRRDSQQVVEREVLIEGRDYEVDAIQGRIILSRPLSQVANDRGPAIIRSRALEGDDVYLLVDYEYVPDFFSADQVTYGGRGRIWFGDHVGLGATAVTDERSGMNYGLNGVDLMLKAGEGTYLATEFASSQASQNGSNLVSVDGGLSFRTQASASPGDDLDGSAVAVEVRINLADIRDTLDGDIRAWRKDRDADFSTGRLGQGTDVTDSGFEAQIRAGEFGTVIAAWSELALGQLSTERVARIQAEGTIGPVSAGVEVRKEDVDRPAPGPLDPVSDLNGAAGAGDALLVGARLGYEFSDKTNLYAAAQTVADESGTYMQNDLYSVGVNTDFGGDMALSLEASDGDRGSALIAGVDLASVDGLDFNLSGGVGSGAISQFATRYSIAEGHELYGSYTVDPDRTEGARNLLTLGQRRAFWNRMSIFAESQFGKRDQYASVGHVFGLELGDTRGWRINGSMQFSENENLSTTFERRALSLGAYLEQEELRLATRVEYREDIGTTVHTRQYVTSNSFTKILDDDRRMLGQLNLSWTDDEQNGGRAARFAEFNIGHAYRPVLNEKLNLLAKYTFLYDLPAEGQATPRPDERSHVLSLDAIYELDEHWELAGKVAIKDGERRVARDAGEWLDFGLQLTAVRARLHINRTWDALAEYRWLKDVNDNSSRHGALVAGYYHLTQNFKAGVGFNFTDFDDDLRLDSYKTSGWFVDFIGKY